jgi:hypothetical protein
MGYHNNEETTKKAIRDANRFINDRSRLEHALRLALKGLGIADSGPQETIISEVKSANFDSIYRVAQEQNNKNITSMLIESKPFITHETSDGKGMVNIKFNSFPESQDFFAALIKALINEQG